MMEFHWTVSDRPSRGYNMVITYDVEEIKPFGLVLVARTEKGVCFLGLPVDGSFDQAIQAMRYHFPQAQFVKVAAHPTSQVIDVHGSLIQIAVWRELLKIPEGETRSYKQIAHAIHKPLAARAVGSAIGANPVCLFIPCHRVIGSNGDMHGFAWGLGWKEKLLQSEQKLATKQSISA